METHATERLTVPASDLRVGDVVIRGNRYTVERIIHSKDDVTVSYVESCRDKNYPHDKQMTVERVVDNPLVEIKAFDLRLGDRDCGGWAVMSLPRASHGGITAIWSKGDASQPIPYSPDAILRVAAKRPGPATTKVKAADLREGDTMCWEALNPHKVVLPLFRPDSALDLGHLFTSARRLEGAVMHVADRRPALSRSAQWLKLTAEAIERSLKPTPEQRIARTLEQAKRLRKYLLDDNATRPNVSGRVDRIIQTLEGK